MRILMIFLLVASPKTLGLCFVLALAPDWSTGSFLADIGDVAAFSAPTVENLGELDTTMKSSSQKDEIDGNNPTAAEINDITIPSQSTDLMSGNLEIPNADLVSESAKVQAIPSSPNSHGKFCKTLSGNSRRAIKLRGELCECLKVEVLCPPPKFTMNNFIWWETLCCVGEIGPYNTFVDNCWKCTCSLHYIIPSHALCVSENTQLTW